MHRRQPVPRLWLMTDPRLGDMPALLRRLPPGTGVFLRHHALAPAERRRLARQLHRLATARRLSLVDARDARGIAAQAHHRREAVAAVRRGARAVFVSPVFATRTHPGQPAIGAARAAAIARGLPVLTIALGGMNGRRFRQVAGVGFDGWAAIDAWAARQKRKAVPR